MKKQLEEDLKKYILSDTINIEKFENWEIPMEEYIKYTTDIIQARWDIMTQINNLITK